MFDWSRVWLIAQRELKVRFRQRSYRITTIVQIVIIALIALAPVLVLRFLPDTVGQSDQAVVAVVDEADANLSLRLPLYLATLAGDDDPVQVEIVDSDAGARQMVDDGDADAALIVTRDAGGELALDLITGSGDAASVEAQQVLAAAGAVAMEDRIDESGLSNADVQAVFAAPDITVTSASGEVATDGGGIDFASYVISFLATILIFLAVVLYGQWIATGVVEEKSSRIMEIMVNAATPRDLLAGKVIGIMLAGLCQFGPMLLVGGLIFAFLPQIGDLVGVDVGSILDVNFGALSVTAILTFLVYFILGFTLYGSLYAGVGSLVSRQEEVSTVVAPLSIVMFVGYFAAIQALTTPDAAFARVAFLVPFTSPFVGVARVMLGNPSAAEVALSIGLLLVAVLAMMWLAGRLYRIGVLMYGQRPGFRSLLRIRGAQGVAR
jgi:ABC-2 type transport system permease protein